MRSGTRETRLAAGRIDRISLAEGEAVAATLRVDGRGGLRLSGELLKIDDQAVWLASPALLDPARLPLDSLRSLTVLRHDGRTFFERVKTEVANAGRSAALLEAHGVRLRGRLVDGLQQPPASCLVWQPFGTSTSAPLRVNASGRIAYEWSPPPRPTPQTAPPQAALDVERRLVEIERQRLLQRVPPGAAMRLGSSGFVPAPADPPAPKPLKDGPHALYLRSGDMIPCEVTGMDARGVTLKTRLLDATFVPHEVIQAVDLHQDPPLAITKSKRDRLLTLPRMQRDNPPTHLIRSRDGDYLRGRLVEMDDRRLLVEVRIETRDLPRDRISRIIWLHDNDPGPPAPAKPEAAALRVQGVHSDGNRLTMFADQLAGETLAGTSVVLGPCQLELGKVGQLLFGGAIDQSAAGLAYQQWKLQPAIEPLGAPDDGGERSAGTESYLVGKPAPDFDLPLLEGGRFRLAGNRGKIIVLDFWATWCGPCLQTMPQIAAVSGAFADRNVQVIAINLEEMPEAITPMLQRHKLSLPVALDRDGAVAAKYSVSTIPQTLVIDADGKVFRHFIGGSSKLGDQLTTSLQALLGETEPQN